MAITMKKNIRINHRIHLAPKGFVILFTILIAAIIMVIGLGIYSIASRETVLSGTAREAQYAFYAADTGVECALYAQHLDLTSGNAPILNSPSSMLFNCGGNPVSVSGNGSVASPYVFNVLVDQDHKTCARVSVYDSGPTRRIISQGYNLCKTVDATPVLSNPLLVERDLDTTYNRSGGSSTSTTP